MRNARKQATWEVLRIVVLDALGRTPSGQRKQPNGVLVRDGSEELYAREKMGSAGVVATNLKQTVMCVVESTGRLFYVIR